MRFRNLHKIEVKEVDRLLFDEPGVIGSGGNSGFQAINIAVQFGAIKIILVGFDLHEGNGIHWYGRNVGKNMRNPLPNNYARWRLVLDRQAAALHARGIDVVNASPDSALTGFRRATIEQVLSEWGI